MTQDPFEAHLQRAEDCFRAGDHRQAGQIWQALLKRDPAHVRAREGLLRVKRALEALPPPPAVSQADLDLLLRQASQLWDLGVPEDALAKWHKVLELDPQNREAKTFIDLVQREQADSSTVRSVRPGPSDAALQAVQAPAIAPGPPAAATEEIATLLRQASQLWDLGVPEDALEKWEKVLRLDPRNSEARAFIDRVRLEEAEAAAAPPSPPRQPTPMASLSPTPQPTPPPPAEDARLLRGERLLQLGRFDEAAYSFQQVLAQHPSHTQALEGLALAQQGTLPSASPLPVARPKSKAKSKPRSGVNLPAALTQAPKRRLGLQIPEPMRALAAHPLLQSPLAWAGGLGVLILATVGFSFWRQGARDRQLKADVSDVIQEALKPAIRASLVVEVDESLAAILAEAKATLADDPLRAYHRAKEALRRVPEDPSAAQLLEQARTALATAGPAPKLEPLTKPKAGDLDGALSFVLDQLRAAPDDPKLLRKAASLLGTLAQLQASSGKWPAAKAHLQRARALYPQDKAWSARIYLLDRISSQPKPEQAGWIALLG